MFKSIKVLFICIFVFFFCTSEVNPYYNSIKKSYYITNINRFSYKELKEGEWEYPVLKTKIEKVLKKSGFYSESMVNLLLGTAATESGFGKFLTQFDSGPAKGIFQFEQETAQHTITSYVLNDQDLKKALKCFYWENVPLGYQLTRNIDFQIFLAAVNYKRRGVELTSDSFNKNQLAGIWKKHWNTHEGRGTVEFFLTRWKQFCER